jgi:hypothetical protein
MLSSEANWKLFSFHHKTLLMLTHTKQRRANILLLFRKNVMIIERFAVLFLKYINGGRKKEDMAWMN